MSTWRNRILLGGLLLHLAAALSAQTVIRDRVVLRPPAEPGTPDSGGATETEYSPCNPPPSSPGTPPIRRFAVYWGDSLSLRSATCPFCPPHHMAGVLSGGEEYVRLRLIGEPGLGGEIAGTSFHFREAWGYDVLAIFDRAQPADQAIVRFTMTYVDFPPPNTEILEVYVIPQPQYTTFLDCQFPAMEYGQSTLMIFGARHWCAGFYPFPHTYTASIVGEAGLGVIVNPANGQRGTSVSGILPQGQGGGQVYFEATGTEPSAMTTVVVRLTPSVFALQPVERTLWVLPPPPCPLVTLVPDRLGPGDTAGTLIVRKKSDGTIVPYPPGTLVFAGISEGYDYCTLYSPAASDTADYYEWVPAEGLRLVVTAESIEESVAVAIWVGPLSSAEAEGKGGADKTVRPPGALRGLFRTHASLEEADECFVGRGVIEQRRYTILVGETKYYQARPHPRVAHTLIIDELSTPELRGGIPEDVWGSSPVLDPGGDSAFVYWERKFPVYSERDSFLRMEALPPGLIRVIGRRNRPGAENGITLTANTGGRSGRIQVQVKRPRILGTSAFARQRSRGLDHEGTSYNVDSLCILWGSLIGIAPQYIKAHFAAECIFDTSLQSYVPSFRYEPWTEEFRPGLAHTFQPGPFWAYQSSMGYGSPVPSHRHVQVMGYSETPKSVWELIEHYSTITTSPAPYGGLPLFGLRLQSTHRLVFTNYKSPRTEYKQIRDSVYRALRIAPEPDNLAANDLAQQVFVNYMKFEYRGGLSNRVAQTRVASSYGSFQIMYCLAVDLGYPTTPASIPEALNDPAVSLPLALEHLRVLLCEARSVNRDHSWPFGWEGTLQRTYGGWNVIRSYAPRILRAALRYPPSE